MGIDSGPSHLQQTVALQSHRDNELQGLTGSALRTVLRPEGLLLLCIVFYNASKHSRRCYT